MTRGSEGPPLGAAEHLAVPYVLTMVPMRGPDGHWLCRAEHPELPGCRADAFAPTMALDQLEERRIAYVLDHLARGVRLPVPRPPLPHLVPVYERLLAGKPQGRELDQGNGRSRDAD